ncbi:MAG TPA: VCBS repeat-containing protein [Opitutaceae bacterium]|nr:VCBS repeat-containing protein [Opitutaceae bacterium]
MLKSLLALVAATASLSAATQTAPALHLRPLSAPSKGAAGGKSFVELTADQTGVGIPNVYNDPRMWADRFREFTLGALETGIAIGDFDRDGHPDIFAVSRNGPCALYLQTAPFKFVNVAPAAGVDCANVKAGRVGATVVDINQDGWPDIYVCLYDSPNLLFINNGDGSFTESAKAYGLDVKDASVHASFADYDRDGNLDCYIVTNILDFSKSPQGRKHYLFHNNGNNTFTDVSAKAGIWGLTQGHTAIWFDANQDGWPDIYVANDFETPDRFYLNNGNGTFTDVVDERLPHATYFSMGADSGDINNDGLIDFMVADMRDRTRPQYMAGMEEVGRGLWENERVSDLIPQYMWNAVYLNTGTDRYAEVAHLTGMDATGWTWAARLGDLDCDGKLDAFYTTGMIRNFVDADLVDKQNVAPTLAARANVWKNSNMRKERTVAYRNNGQLNFTDVSSAWGLDHEGVSFGCALADMDNDGDLDIVYINFDSPPTIIRNDTQTGHRAVVALNGQKPNLTGIGAEIRIETASGAQVRQIYTERGIVSSEPAEAVFGLGADDQIKKLTVRWPRGQVQTFENVAADKRITINEPAVENPPAPPSAIVKNAPRPDALFHDTTAATGIKVSNTIKSFDEFEAQRLLPRRLGLVASAVTTADVNGDGIADVFVSGIQGDAGVLYLGQKDGSFAAASAQPWAKAAGCDDVAALFVDVNGDKHPDLVVASGGVARPRGDATLGARVYLNDGKGEFTEAPAGMLPESHEASRSLAAAEIDGATELFVGGRLVPGRWPETPKSALYRSKDGKLVDVTDEQAPGLREIGMVTAAQFADIDGDGKADLILTLEFGSVVYFHNTGKGFENRTSAAGLADVTGWWSALAIADVNGDGRQDLVVGNNGLNTKYHATKADPTLVYYGDFDGRGKNIIVEAQSENGKIYPLRGRSKLGYSFPGLAKKFKSYAAYGQATIDEIFAPEYLAKVRKLSANELASGIFLQKKNGRFEFQRLPNAAQIAPINSIAVGDFDGDGAIDLYCAGNNFGPEPTTGRFDGGVSTLLLGNGKGEFSAVLPAQSGLVVPGEARSVAIIPNGNSKAVSRVIVAQCNRPVTVFARTEKLAVKDR